MIAWLRHWLARWPSASGTAQVRCDEAAGSPSCPEFAAGELLAAAWGGPANTHFRRGG